jgi:hypothetical protein
VNVLLLVAYGVFLVLCMAVILEAAALDLSRMIVLIWVRIYTAGVPAEDRYRRREEMAEHLFTERDGSRPEWPAAGPVPSQQRGLAPLARGARTMWRLFKGLWNDVAWAGTLIVMRLFGRTRRSGPPRE